MKYIAIMFTLSAAGIVALSGCAGSFINQYGYAAPDSEIVREDGNAVFIPSNSHSISQGFKPQEEHEGIDIVGKRGTPVIAAAGGIVISSYYEPFFGNRVVIDHGRNENSLYMRSRYFHLNKRLVNEGENVVRGQQIGELGSKGLLASYPHLHFEVRARARQGQNQSEPLNPHKFWVDGAGIVTCFEPGRELPDMPFKTTFPVPCS
jgi:murein DD-endopeptidase MepM/ murein hydrolase activator NlpD